MPSADTASITQRQARGDTLAHCRRRLADLGRSFRLRIIRLTPSWLVSLFLLACIVIPVEIVRRSESKREISPYVGETIYGVKDKSHIEES